MTSIAAQPFNPYEAPRSATLLSPHGGAIYFDGDALVIPKEYTFPPICIKTGAPAENTPQRRRKLSWYPPMLGWLALLNLLLFAIVAAIVSKKGEIRFHLSEEVAAKRRNVLLRNWSFFLLSIALFYASVSQKAPVLALVAMVLFIVSLILTIPASRFLYPKRIDATHIRLCGIPKDVAMILAESHGQMSLSSAR